MERERERERFIRNNLHNVDEEAAEDIGSRGDAGLAS